MTAIGPHRPGDPRGWLVFETLPDDLQRAEDATQAADYEHRGTRIDAARRALGLRRFQEWDAERQIAVWALYRPATTAERTLLEHLGYTLPTRLDTRVEFRTETFRQRRWPALETQTPTGESV